MSMPNLESVKVARQAMATRFELVLYGANPVALRAAGEEALDEIQRLEAQLNLYAPTSEISRVNTRAAREAVKVEAGLFRLLQLAQSIHRETEGAFDVTIAPLMRCWGFMEGSGSWPEASALAEARSRVGMHLVELDPSEFTVRFKRDGVRLDLGAIGKGYAIAQAAELLREAGVASALIHGGTSTVCALGHPPDQESWKVAIEFPQDSTIPSSQPALPAPNPFFAASEPSRSSRLLAVVPLQDAALSVSAVWGKAFQSENKTCGHVIDPRTGHPAGRAMLAAVALPCATETDAFSTALLVGGLEAMAACAQLRPGMRTLVAGPGPQGGEIWAESIGLSLELADQTSNVKKKFS
jgi:FAD:protein FMN transferase